MSNRISLELEPSIAKAVPNKGGRPRKEISQHTFEGLCEIQCTLAEIAGVLRVSEDTVERWCQRTYELGFADTYKKFSATGKTSLRRHQFELAKKGNATMLIWLGKQYLGQSDKLITEEHEEKAYEDQRSKLLYSSVEEIAVREQISERDVALRLAKELEDMPELAAQCREWAVGSAPRLAALSSIATDSLEFRPNDMA